MTDRTLSIHVEGVKDITSALRRMASETPKEVSKYHKQVAETVAVGARSRAAGRPRQDHTGHIEKAIKASGTQREAAVKVATADAIIQEFGGRAPLFGNHSRWYTVRAPSRDGYFLYPAVKSASTQIERLYLTGLESAIRKYWDRVG